MGGDNKSDDRNAATMAADELASFGTAAVEAVGEFFSGSSSQDSSSKDSSSSSESSSQSNQCDDKT